MSVLTAISTALIVCGLAALLTGRLPVRRVQVRRTAPVTA